MFARIGLRWQRVKKDTCEKELPIQSRADILSETVMVMG
jgi:hypothetical protein